MLRNPEASSGLRCGNRAPIRNALPSGPIRHTSAHRTRSRSVQTTRRILEGCSQAGSIAGSSVRAPRYRPNVSVATTRNAKDNMHSDPLPYRNSSKYGVSVAVASAIANIAILDMKANDDNVFSRPVIIVGSVCAWRRRECISTGTSMSKMVCYKFS